jgi:hypothetical protein
VKESPFEDARLAEGAAVGLLDSDFRKGAGFYNDEVPEPQDLFERVVARGLDLVGRVLVRVVRVGVTGLARLDQDVLSLIVRRPGISPANGGNRANPLRKFGAAVERVV